MEYTKTVWKDLPDTSTPITADKLNNLEDGVEYLFEHGAGGGDTLPIGIILPFSDDTIPEGYMLCDGAAISRTTYARLFSIIGTTYGAGDGSTTFNLPNLKGKVPVGYDSTDSDFDTLGETGGEKTHVLADNELPNTTNKYLSNASSGLDWGIQSGTSYAFKGVSLGSGEAHNNLQPYQVVNYIIKVLNAQNGEVRSESLPVGTELDYDGSTVPTGWEQVSDKEKLLWINPDSTQAITTETTINLNSSDYDILEMFFNQRSTNNPATYSIKFLKNSPGTRCYIPSTDGNIYRTITKNTDTSLTISTIIGSQNSDSTLVIPIYVIGYKTGLFS